MASLLATAAVAQDITTVNATSSEISDNLDLRAVASIFGDADNLEDFERKLNDPDLQISNLDLNNDNQVDYLRVIESVDRGTHLIIVQSVLARDVYQDVATIEVERDANNNVQVQVVGDVYMYGPNYIYEPVYVHRPVIFTTFWVGNYRPYCSTWYWGYYPRYFYAWHPYPVFRYRRNVHVHINVHHHYNYVNVRRSDRAVTMYSTRRSDGYARQYPSRSFQKRHDNVANRYELDQRRNTRDLSVKNGLMASNTRNSAVRNSVRTEAGVRNNGAVRSNTRTETTPRANGATRTRDYQSTSVRNTPRESNTRTFDQATRTRDNQSTRTSSAPRENTRTFDAASSTRTRDNQAVRAQSSTPRENTSTRAMSTPRPTRTESAPTRSQRIESAPRPQRMEPATRSQAPRMESQRASRGENRASQGATRSERNSDSRR